MPSTITGPIKISSVSGGATILFGDVGYIAPKSASKTSSGPGGNTGDYSSSYVGVSNVNTYNPVISDSSTRSGT